MRGSVGEVVAVIGDSECSVGSGGDADLNVITFPKADKRQGRLLASLSAVLTCVVTPKKRDKGFLGHSGADSQDGTPV